MPKTKPLPFFSRRLVELREARGLSRYRLAVMTEGDLSDQGIANIELKGAVPSLLTALALARALGVSLLDLIESEQKIAQRK